MARTGDTSAATYSLWAAPEAQAERAIAETIRSIAQRLQTPSFLPHMTVLGGISVRERLRVELFACGAQ